MIQAGISLHDEYLLIEIWCLVTFSQIFLNSKSRQIESILEAVVGDSQLQTETLSFSGALPDNLNICTYVSMWHCHVPPPPQ